MKKHTLLNENKQSGFTLVEALVVMLVGIVILAAAAAGINKLFHASEINTAANNISQLQVNIRGLKNGSEGYTELNNKSAVALKAVPDNMVVASDGGVIKNAWGGDVTIKSENSNQAFSLTYAGVPAEACQQLALKLRNAGWTAIKIGGANADYSKLSAIQLQCVEKSAGKGTELTFENNG